MAPTPLTRDVVAGSRMLGTGVTSISPYTVLMDVTPLDEEEVTSSPFPPGLLDAAAGSPDKPT